MLVIGNVTRASTPTVDRRSPNMLHPIIPLYLTSELFRSLSRALLRRLEAHLTVKLHGLGYECTSLVVALALRGGMFDEEGAERERCGGIVVGILDVAQHRRAVAVVALRRL